MTRFFYESFNPQTWFGFNLLAVDGTTLHVPDESPISEQFGVWKSTKGETPCPKVRASQMFDVLNKITVDAGISPKSQEERELAAFQFLKLLPNDLILLDCGYPAHWIFKLLLSKDTNFCARISYKRWRAVKKFYLSGKKEQMVKIQSIPTSIRKCIEMGLDKKTIKVRVIRIEMDSGETEILVTSLTDMKKYPCEIFWELYHRRNDSPPPSIKDSFIDRQRRQSFTSAGDALSNIIPRLNVSQTTGFNYAYQRGKRLTALIRIAPHLPFIYRWSTLGLPGSWEVLPYLCPAHRPRPRRLRYYHLSSLVLPSQQ